MSSRFLIALLCVGALAVACGPRTHSSEPSRQQEPAVRRDQGSSLASSLRVTVDDAGDGVRLAFHVTNATGKRLELIFPSGQTHDFVVLDSAERVVWRWSEGRMFTQAVQTKLLAGGETLTYDERWDPAGRRGKHTAVAVLHSQSHRLESRVEFTLP